MLYLGFSFAKVARHLMVNNKPVFYIRLAKYVLALACPGAVIKVKVSPFPADKGHLYSGMLPLFVQA
jgi:hypothetical protein